MNFQSVLEKYNIEKCEPLNKGWSRDKKFVLTAFSGEKFLIRISNSALYEKKKKQFELLQLIKELNINCSKPIEFGVFSSGEVYTLLSWLEGYSAEEVVGNMTDEQAYNIGVESGKLLQKLHAVPVELSKQSWEERYYEKMERKFIALDNCEIALPKKNIIVDFARENMYLVKDREQTFCHSDYHLGNMIVNNGKIGVIDFDKNAVADPYDEFKPFCWNVFASEYFETGLINGYFNDDIPKDFFKVLALYASESLISHLPWATTFGQTEIETALKVTNAVLLWYNDFSLTVPTWYKGSALFKNKQD